MGNIQKRKIRQTLFLSNAALSHSLHRLLRNQIPTKPVPDIVYLICISLKFFLLTVAKHKDQGPVSQSYKCRRFTSYKSKTNNHKSRKILFHEQNQPLVTFCPPYISDAIKVTSHMDSHNEYRTL